RCGVGVTPTESKWATPRVGVRRTLTIAPVELRTEGSAAAHAEGRHGKGARRDVLGRVDGGGLCQDGSTDRCGRSGDLRVATSEVVDRDRGGEGTGVAILMRPFDNESAAASGNHTVGLDA